MKITKYLETEKQVICKICLRKKKTSEFLNNETKIYFQFQLHVSHGLLV